MYKLPESLTKQILCGECREDIVFSAMPQNASKFILAVRKLLFPLKKEFNQQVLEQAASNLSLEFDQLFIAASDCKIDAVQLKEDFFKSLSDFHHRLSKDAKAILGKDPAATNCFEIVAAYPGFYAILTYRIANFFYLNKIPLIPRMLAEVAHSVTGIDIHPGASIGESFAIDHGTGIVIGETTAIGNNVTMYQGVTLGGLVVDKSSTGKKRHPTIEDNVTIYANATILGGDTVIGANSIIGGSTWITKSVESGSQIKFTN